MNSPTPTIITPTVGRVVWFYPPTNSAESDFARPGEDAPLAAVIACVLNDSCVNLAVFDANGTPHSRTGVLLVQDGQAVPRYRGHCEWMPFQKGQAKAQEAASASQSAIAAPFELQGRRNAVPVTEQELVSNALAPRVTEAQVEAAIAAEYYFTADEGVYGHEVLVLDSVSTPEPEGPLGQITICVLLLRNGTKIVGVNEGPVSPENFDHEIGKRYARAAAVRQIWPLLGYVLRQQQLAST